MSSTATSLLAFRNLLSSDDLESIPANVNGDEYLMRFLRFKSDPQRAYETLVKYHSFRKRDKNLFARMRPNVLKPLIDSKIITKLPGNDAKGNPVILVQCKRWDEKLYSLEDVLLLIMLMFEELIRTKVSRVAVLFDWEGYGLSHYRQFTYRNIKRNIALAKGAFPISFKGIHQVNESRLFWLLFKIMFSFLSAKLKKRIHVHGKNRESLAAHIPFSTLPVDYGGTSEDVDTDFINEMYKNTEYYEALANFV